MALDVENGRTVSRKKRCIAISSRIGLLEAGMFLCGAGSGDVADMIIASGVEVVHRLAGPIDELPGWYTAGASLDGKL